LIALLLIDVKLGLLALLLSLLIDAFLHKNAIYVGGNAFFFSRKGVFANFSLEPAKKAGMLSLSRGLKILGGEIRQSDIVSFAFKLSRKIAKMRGRRKGGEKGAVTGYLIPHKKYFKPLLISSIRRAVLRRKKLKPVWEDLVEARRDRRARTSMIIVLDSSASMMYSLRGIYTAIKGIEKESRRHRDRISLIVCKGFGSVVVQQPTTNFNLLLSKLKEVGLNDFTPLASGMFRGYLLALRERRRGYEPILVVISDGNVNVPLEKPFRSREYSIDPAVQSVLYVTDLIAKAKIETVIINTKHREPVYESAPLISGTELLIKVAKKTRGSYVGLI